MAVRDEQQHKTQLVYGTTHDANPSIAETKQCPRCGETLFADMDICYGCLYNFCRREGDDPMSPNSLSVSHAQGSTNDESHSSSDDALEKTGVLKLNQTEPIPHHASPWEEGWYPLDEVDDCDMTRVLGQDTHPANIGLNVRSASMDVTMLVPEEGLSVGRGQDNDIVLHMRTVSRCHLRVVPQDKGALVIDQGATNLALVDGEELKGSVQASVGSRIELGGACLKLVGIDA